MLIMLIEVYCFRMEGSAKKSRQLLYYHRKKQTCKNFLEKEALRKRTSYIPTELLSKKQAIKRRAQARLSMRNTREKRKQTEHNNYQLQGQSQNR